MHSKSRHFQKSTDQLAINFREFFSRDGKRYSLFKRASCSGFAELNVGLIIHHNLPSSQRIIRQWNEMLQLTKDLLNRVLISPKNVTVGIVLCSPRRLHALISMDDDRVQNNRDFASALDLSYNFLLRGM